MRNTQKISFSVIVALLVIFFSSSMFPAFAHSGRTDGDGGHTNHSTGEYHWHHGYSAHQHEDRDGDGYPEYCPYRIQKNTDNKNKESYDCGVDGCNIKTQHGHINKEKADEVSTKNTIDWEDIVVTIIILLLFSPAILAIVGGIVGSINENVIQPIMERIRKKK